MMRATAEPDMSIEGGIGMNDKLIKDFAQADEIREFSYGRFEIVNMAGVSLGRATYQPGWKWSRHNAPIVGTDLCHTPHTGTVLIGSRRRSI